MDDERVHRFDALYAEHYRAVYAFVYRRRAPRAGDAADVTADVFAVAWRRLDAVPEGGERLWLYGVAYRCVARARRGDWRRLRLIVLLGEQARVGAHAAVVSDCAAELRDALARLRPRDREVLALTVWEGLSHAEAAVVLGCSVNAVAQRVHAARERLRDELAKPTAGSAEMTTT